MGLRQYDRIRFTDGQPHFKSVFFMYRGNHGQWNTVWAGKKSTARSGRYLDLRALIGPEEQRQFAKVVISGFLEATLHQRREYLPMFRDHRTAGQWLPKTMYTTRFEESAYRPLAEFDGDVDLTTGTVPGVVLAGDSLSTWNENVLPFRWKGSETQNHNAVWLGWNNRLAADDKEAAETPGEAGTKTPGKPAAPGKTAAKGASKSQGKAGAKPGEKPEDKLELGKPASYVVSLPDGLASAWGISERSAVYLSLAATTAKPGPRGPQPKKEEEAEVEAKKQPEGAKAPPKPKPPPKPKEPKKPKEKPDVTPVDLTVELVDADFHVARLPLSRFGIARRPLESRIFRRKGRDADRFANIYELVAQTFVMPIADFIELVPEFDPRRLVAIRLLFDRTEAATVIVEQVGLSTPADPAFLASPVR